MTSPHPPSTPQEEAEHYVVIGNTRYPVNKLLHYCREDPAVSGFCNKQMVEHCNETIADALTRAERRGRIAGLKDAIEAGENIMAAEISNSISRRAASLEAEGCRCGSSGSRW